MPFRLAVTNFLIRSCIYRYPFSTYIFLMAWRITQHVVRGTLNNEQKGLVTGSIWLAGRESPLTVELHGNFLRDLAGGELMFENPNPVEPAHEFPNLDPLQIGLTGDMTASRKINLVDAKRKNGKTRKANALYLEWFSETNGRIVIEATDFSLQLSPSAWLMDAADEQAQINANRQAFRDWLEHLSEIEEEEEMEHSPNLPDRPMNEFEWEKVLRDSDRKNERLGEVLEKYHGHPDSEKLIAREMGWTWVEEELEAQERGVFIESAEPEARPFSDAPDFFSSRDDDDDEDDLLDEDREPDPAREGIDWMRDEDGSIEHPLAVKALQFSSLLWRELEDQGLLGENGDSRVFEWVGLIESAGVRLSTTLGDVAFGDDVEPGYIIAGLKRSVHQIHQALDLLQQIEPLNLIERTRAKDCQVALFELREEVIAMMMSFRRKA